MRPQSTHIICTSFMLSAVVTKITASFSSQGTSALLFYLWAFISSLNVKFHTEHLRSLLDRILIQSTPSLSPYHQIHYRYVCKHFLENPRHSRAPYRQLVFQGFCRQLEPTYDMVSNASSCNDDKLIKELITELNIKDAKDCMSKTIPNSTY